MVEAALYQRQCSTCRCRCHCLSNCPQVGTMGRKGGAAVHCCWCILVRCLLGAKRWFDLFCQSLWCSCTRGVSGGLLHHCVETALVALFCYTTLCDVVCCRARAGAAAVCGHQRQRHQLHLWQVSCALDVAACEVVAVRRTWSAVLLCGLWVGSRMDVCGHQRERHTKQHRHETSAQ
jgi:hypothetical protein